MQLKNVTDQNLLTNVRQLAQNERDVLTKILHYLREIERRRLFSDLGYASLFDFAVKELKYSEGQAGRRIQVMRLVKEIPQVEEKIASGKLSLSNVSQAQSFFREMARVENGAKAIAKEQKLEVLLSLENKSAREGQKELLKLQPAAALPKERERILTEEHSEIRFVMSKELKAKLEQVRSLLGSKGASLSFAELLEVTADESVKSLEGKKFGKARAAAPSNPTSELIEERKPSKNVRYIPREIAHIVWRRDKNRCAKCGSKINLQIDHVVPVALGGQTRVENLRLLCFSCNQREAIKAFGLTHMESATKLALSARSESVGLWRARQR